MHDSPHDAGLGFECVSLAEVELVRSQFAALPPSKILFTPNFIGRFEYVAALKVWPFSIQVGEYNNKITFRLA